MSQVNEWRVGERKTYWGWDEMRCDGMGPQVQQQPRQVEANYKTVVFVFRFWLRVFAV